jgi:nitrate/nitrite transporter NarK
MDHLIGELEPFCKRIAPASLIRDAPATAGFLGGCMNFSGNIAGVTVPIVVGIIVQITSSYFLAMCFLLALEMRF